MELLSKKQPEFKDLENPPILQKMRKHIWKRTVRMWWIYHITAGVNWGPNQPTLAETLPVSMEGDGGGMELRKACALLAFHRHHHWVIWLWTYTILQNEKNDQKGNSEIVRAVSTVSKGRGITLISTGQRAAGALEWDLHMTELQLQALQPSGSGRQNIEPMRITLKP